jgi:hypothetical protein
MTVGVNVNGTLVKVTMTTDGDPGTVTTGTDDGMTDTGTRTGDVHSTGTVTVDGGVNTVVMTIVGTTNGVEMIDGMIERIEAGTVDVWKVTKVTVDGRPATGTWI